ncbi:MAG: hypothetical protein JWP06_264 [Candidatus Saccharibacteria bacterium]|nr:hypothetical protein [Candidatus Saccharibacteria bacterium]
MSLAYSNVLATVAVVCLPLVGRSRIAPKLSPLLRRYFFTLTMWGLPFAIGQYCQENRWGSLWVQYHLLDLSYAPWGMALIMCLFLIGADLLNTEVSKRLLLVSSFAIILAFGYGSEVWDTMWAWYDGEPFALAIDVGDYITITAGGVATVVLYLWLRQSVSKGMS